MNFFCPQITLYIFSFMHDLNCEKFMCNKDVMQACQRRVQKPLTNGLFSRDFTPCLCFMLKWILTFITIEYSEAFFKFQPVSNWIQNESGRTKFMLIYENWYIKECVKETPRRKDRMWVHNLDDLTWHNC